MKGIVPATTEFVKKHRLTILTVLGTIGLGSTIVLTVKATTKASKVVTDEMETKEIIEETWKYYIPVALSGSATLACFWGANILNKRTQASLASAYALVDTSYKEYVGKLKELYGEETHNNVVDAIMKDHCEDVCITNAGILSVSTLDIDSEEPEVTRTFYDDFSHRYFDSTMSKVLQAEYHFNRNYAMCGSGTLNNFYDFLGLAHIDGGDDIGWCVYEGELYWVDFNHRVTTLDDGMEVVHLCYDFDPTPIPEEW